MPEFFSLFFLEKVLIESKIISVCRAISSFISSLRRRRTRVRRSFSGDWKSIFSKSLIRLMYCSITSRLAPGLAPEIASQTCTIGEINVTGNTNTRDKVVRRELRLFEGELYNETNKRKSLANVRRLGFFDNVEFQNKVSSEGSDVMDLDVNVKERFNSFGKKVFNYLYTSTTQEDLKVFIEEQVLKGNDWMKNKRNTFCNEEVLPKNGNTASENIYYQIKCSINL